MFIDPTSSEKPLEEQVKSKISDNTVSDPTNESSEEVKLEAYNLHLKGYTNTAISQKLGISGGQVMSWVRQMREQFKDSLTEQSGAELLSALMEEYEFLKSFAFAQLQDICVTVSEDGTVSKKKTDHSAAAKYLDIIAKTIKDRADLLSKTGALPREPDKLDINIRGESKTEVTHKFEREERSEDQILHDIQERLKHSQTL